jgi:hypothetical protein
VVVDWNQVRESLEDDETIGATYLAAIEDRLRFYKGLVR